MHVNGCIISECANLDVILGVQSLNKTGETVEETICCCSLEASSRARERKSRFKDPFTQ